MALLNTNRPQNVSTITGAASKAGSEDGDLASAKLNYMWGIAAVGNNTVLVFQRQNSEPRVRLISVDDNKVTTVHPGFKGGKPAVTKDKQECMILVGTEHIQYMSI